MHRRRALLWFAVAMAEAAVAIGGAFASGDTSDAVGSYVVTNTAMGIAFPLCGVLIARAAPRNPIGWLFLAFGTAHLTTAALAPLAEGSLALTTVMLMAWPFGIGLCLPLALQLFPTGRPLSPRWRPLIVVTVAAGILFSLWFGTDGGYLRSRGANEILAVSNPLILLVFAATLTTLVLRWRRGDDLLRRQLLWLVLAVLGMIVLNAQRFVLGDGPVLPLLAVNLIPLAVTVAILRDGLFDIRLVVSRTLLYLLLSAAVVGAYAALVAVLDRGLGGPVLATLAIALAFNPARVRLQRRVDRLFYGARNDPVHAVSTLGSRLAGGGDGLDGVPGAVREALRLPYAEIRDAGGTSIAADGQPAGEVHTVALTYRGEQVGELVAGIRGGQRRLSAADLAVLRLLGVPLAVAVHATALTAELQASRERLIVAIEEERRRLHRELHDSLGPALTGAAFKADAVGNLVGADPDRARTLGAELSGQIREAIDDVRRLVYGLRPPVLEELGLLGALRREAGRLGGAGLRIDVHAPDELPALSAAVEVAAYRIATEALTNTVRHAAAGRVGVRLATGPGTLTLTVTDDGPGSGPWRPGVGLRSAAERAAEVGGTCTAGPTPAGGRVDAVLPVEVS